MKTAALLSAILLATSSHALSQCESSPKRIDDEKTVSLGTLLLKSSGEYYVLDSCVRISRSQYGSAIKLGFINNFEQPDAAAFYSVKAKRTLEQDQRVSVSLVRSSGWFGYLTSRNNELQPVPQVRGDPFRGTVAQWNQAHVDGAGPEELRNIPGLSRPWHAFVDQEKSLASTADSGFWRIGPSEITPKTVITNYLIRFTPGQTFRLLDFDVYIQEGVQKVELVTSSQIEAFSKSRTFLIVP
jgi:hypothetical protein